MGRRVAALTLDHLQTLGEQQVPCRSCLVWALDPVRRSRVATGAPAAAEKDAWVSALLRDWGSCGRVVLVDGVPVGLAVYAPPGLVPGAAAYPTAPVSSDAVLLTELWVHPEHRGGGLGRLLVQAVARDLVGRGAARAVEVFARAGGAGVLGAAGCTAPSEFWGRVGFRTQRPHPRTPRMRMDLRSTVTWREEVEAALERLVGAVRPAPAPVPVPTPDARVPATRAGDGDGT